MSIPNFYQGRPLEVPVTYEKFEEVTSGLLERLKTHVESALEEAGFDKEDIHKVLLVGGSTRVRWVKNWLTEFFEKEPDSSLNADEAVAEGAARMAC